MTFETISDGTIGVTAFVDEDDMSSDSATLVPTQQSVKAYVDSQVTAQDLDFQADSGGALSIDLDSEALTLTGGTGIDTSGSGNAVTFAIDSTVATLTGTQTLTNKTLTTPVISGNLTTDGNIDGRDVATDGTKLDGIESGATADQTAAEIRTLVDSATDSNVFTDADHTKLDGIEANATADQTAAEIRTLVDSATDSNVFTDADHTKLDGIETSATADQTDAEIRAAVEAATDSNVFTDADHTKLDGIEASADVTDTANVTAAGALMDSELTSEASVKALNQGVATTDSPTFAGATINGTVTVDGGDAVLSDTIPRLHFMESDTTDLNTRLRNQGGEFQIHSVDDAKATPKKRIILDNATGDINFYEDTGTTAKLFWDASAESLGIGTSSPAYALHVSGGATNIAAVFESTDADTWVSLIDSNTTNNSTVMLGVETDDMIFRAGGAEYMRLDSSGNVGIGTDSPAETLHVAGSIRLGVTGAAELYTNTAELRLGVDKNNDNDTSNITFYVDNAEAMRLDSSGQVGIGTDSPNSNLEVSSDTGSASPTATELKISSSTNASDWSITDNWGVLGFYSDDGSGGGAGNRAEIAINMETATGAYGSVNFTLANPGASYAQESWLKLQNSASSANRRVDIEADGGLYVNKNVEIGTQDTGTASSKQLLTLVNPYGNTGAAARLWLSGTNATTRGAYIEAEAQSSANQHDLIFATSAVSAAPTERVRIDSSGNLLVGTTSGSGASAPDNSSTASDAGIRLSGSGYVGIGNNTNPSLYLNIIGADGDIARFNKDGTTVGSIGARSGDLLIGTTDVGLRFDDNASAYIPFNVTTSLGRDAGIDLGAASVRYKNLYLSGGVYLGGTGSANKLDDYEEGTWDPEFGGEGSNPTVVYNTQKGSYTKVGRLVTVSGQIITVSRSGGSGNLTINNLPFTVQSGEAPFSGVIGFNFNWVSGEQPNGAVANQGTTKLFLYKNTSINSHNEVDDILASGNSYLYFNLTYFTA